MERQSEVRVLDRGLLNHYAKGLYPSIKLRSQDVIHAWLGSRKPGKLSEWDGSSDSAESVLEARVSPGSKKAKSKPRSKNKGKHKKH